MHLPQVHKLSRASQVSLLAVVILLGAIFFTVNSALQQQNENGHANTTTYASISIRGVTSNAITTGATQISLTKPSGVVAGDVFIAQVVVHDYITDITPPTGWTLIRKDSSNPNLVVALYYHVATGVEGSSFVWKFSQTAQASGGIIDLVNVDTTNPIDVTSGHVNDTTGTMTADSVTTTTPVDKLLYFGGVVGTATITPPSGMTTKWSANTVGTTYSDNTAFLAEQLLSSAGATGNRVAQSSLTGRSSISQLVAVRPHSTTVIPTNTPSPTTVVPTISQTGKIGNTFVGSVQDTNDMNCLNGLKVTAPSTGGTITSVSVYISNAKASPNNKYTIGIYSNNSGHPANLLVQSATGTLVTGWNTIPVTLSLTANTSYWLMYGTNGDNDIPYNNQNTPNNGAYICPVYLGSFPSNIAGATIDAAAYSIYATLGTPVNPTNTPVPPTAVPTLKPTPTCAPPPQCYSNGVMFCTLPVGGWCGYGTPTPKPVTPTSCPPPPSCIQNGVNICMVPVGGWCNFGTPTPVPTIHPTNVPQPTETPVPGSTVLHVAIGLHGIGNGGDSANPNSQGNMSPLHPTRTITADIYDTQNQLVISQQGTATFNNGSGKFDGSIDLGSNFASGLYTVKIKSDQYLRTLVPGIQSITSGQTNNLPSVSLVAGDINGDNAINIVDYNILIGCYSDLLPATDCNATNNVLADITDDGHVNQFDYNLFLRELTNIGGQ